MRPPGESFGPGDDLADHRRDSESTHRRDDVTRADARTRAESKRQMLGSGAHLGGGTKGALRVVLMRDRDPEDGQDSVTAQLSHDASVTRANGASRIVIPLEHAAERLRVEGCNFLRVGELREDAGHRRRASGATVVRSADNCGGDSGGTSWRRMAASRSRSASEGSMPSPSTNARRAARNAASASAWRPAR